MKKKLLVLLIAVIPTLMPNLASALVIIIACTSEINLNETLGYEVDTGVCWPEAANLVPD